MGSVIPMTAMAVPFYYKEGGFHNKREQVRAIVMKAKKVLSKCR